MTTSARPKIRSVPWVVFNGKYNKEILNEALEDFFKVSCKLLNNLPKNCNGELSNYV